MKNHSAFLLRFFMLLVPLGLLAQEGSISTLELPKVAPVSPEAASLGKYGDLPVNLASGRINYTIPIFTIKETDLELPIYLSYNHSGLLAEEDPGLAGLGWTLHAGGMIVRQLRGKPDEGSLGYVAGNIGNDWVIPFNFSQWNNLPPQERTDNEYNLFDGATTGRLDTQPDKFIINAGNLSGNFSYNELGEAIFYPHKNYEIENNNGYTVTDDNGVSYEFHLEENTLSEPISNTEQINPPMNYVSGWALTKIVSPTSNNTIDLDYTQGVDYFKQGISESLSRLTSNYGNSERCINQPIKTSGVNNTVFGKQQISKITYSQGSVYFDIREVPNNSHSNSKNYLHSITIKNKLEETISTYVFEYDDLVSNFKLLTAVRKYGKNDVELPFFNLEYNGTPPTQIDYKNQDTWGYYNGNNGNSNTYLITGNRTVDFLSTSLGALTKITYPTGGYSEIEYEGNRGVMPLEAYREYIENTGVAPYFNSFEEINLTSPGSNSITFTLPSSQAIKVSLETKHNSGMYLDAEVIISSTNNGFSNLSCNPYTTIGDNCLKIANTQAENGEVSGGSSNKDYENYFFAESGIPITISATYGGNAQGRAKVRVDYYDPSNGSSSEYIEFIENETTYIDTRVGGIRVKSTSDCNNSTDCLTKNYIYERSDGYSSGNILYSPTYKYSYTIHDNGSSCTIEQRSSSSKIPLASFQGAPVLYNRVETIYNNSTTNGKSIKYFTTEQNPSPSFPFPPRETKDWKKGLLVREEIYKNVNNQLFKIKGIKNTYDVFYPFPTGLQDRKHSIGEVVGRHTYRYINSSLREGELLDYSERSYNNRPEFYHLTQSIESNYENGTVTLTQQTDYDYDDLTGYPKEVTTTNSNGETLRSETIYPTSGPLVTQNRIATPIKTETYKDSELLAAQNTMFANYGNYYLPSEIQTSKGSNPLESRINFDDYFDNGTIKEVSKVDGTPIIYVYGYNNTQPIAKIENASYVGMSTSLSNAITAAKDASNLDTDETTEIVLRTALKDLRDHSGLANAMVSTYTYDPLIGVTSMTDPRGQTIYYVYDEFNRLKHVKDEDGHILSENEYNYAQN